MLYIGISELCAKKIKKFCTCGLQILYVALANIVQILCHFFAITLPEAQPITKSLQLGSLPRVQCTYTRSSLTVEQSTLKQLELFIHFVV